MIEGSVARRVAKGLDLVGAVTPHGDLFIVRGDTGNYTVSLDHQTYGETCSCPDWRNEVLRKGNTGHVCKHLFATTLFLARGCRRGPKILRH